MTKLPLLVVLAACGSTAPTTSSTTPTAPTNETTGAGDDTRLSPDQYPERKLQILRTPSEMTWAEAPQAKGVATTGAWGNPAKEGGWFIKIAQGAGTQQTYEYDARGVVVTGTLKPATPPSPNTRVAALSAGATYFQPAGTPKTLECASGECVVFVETTGAKEGGSPTEQRAYELTWEPLDPKNATGPQVAQVWGDKTSGPNGLLIKIPAGNPTFWHMHRNDHHAVVLEGGVFNNLESGKEPKDLPAGSYIFEPGGNKHTANCKAGGAECLVYMHFLGAYDTKAM
ncbi:MAG: DUF4437 domain-containing protein [Kofleriaceae bacterium]|nr:DUF4437 domain-containing protein [Kofleriaceae bacterium]